MCSTDSVLDAIKDPDSQVFDADRSRIRQLGFCGYLVLCNAVTISSAAATIGLWSDMGCGQICVEFLERQANLLPYCGGVVALVVVILYMLDFFCPPHLPGLYFTLSEDGSILARCCLLIAGAACIALVFLMAHCLPTVPPVASIFLCPLFVMLLRQTTMPRERFSHRSSDVSQQCFAQRIVMLKMVTGEERDQKNFYIAATCAFLAAGLISLFAWVPWAILDKGCFGKKMHAAESRDMKELIFVRYAIPVIVGVSNLIFASFTGLRVALNHAYTATDEVRNRLIIGGKQSCMNKDMMEYRMNRLREQLEDGQRSPSQVLRETKDKMQQYFVQHISHMRQLSYIVQAVGCAFVALIGALYLACQLAFADGHIAFMVQGFIAAFFLTFVLVIFVSFSRLWYMMSAWLYDLPLWKSAAGLCRTDWARAFCICLAFPFVPLVLVLSFMNQRVRRCRGLHKEHDRQWLTDRIHDLFLDAKEWNWVSVIHRCYMMATLLIVYKLIPLFLNVLLAWMSWLMLGLSFAWICVATFLIGIVLFMLPPIPGPPIYLFGGFAIPQKCPWGFWWGSIACITLCFVLKLTACVIQQKLFGEQLGNLKLVRQLVGVHKPFIRAIEKVLQRPGFAFGKCMILCGGPDWPTSVLAGILRVSLWQCLLGTLPIILSVVPLSLTGSFYLMREERHVWVRAGNLMFSLTVLVSVVFWAGMGWVIQEVFDREHEELTRAKEEYVELEWLDHRSMCIAAKCTVVWTDLHLIVKVPYIIGCIAVTVISMIFFWNFQTFFGSFKVTDDITKLRWTGEGGLVKPPGLVALSIAGAGYFGLIVYSCWARCRGWTKRSEAAREVDLIESAWKEHRLQEARSAKNTAPRSFGNSNPPCWETCSSVHGDEVATGVAILESGEVLSGTDNVAPLSTCISAASTTEG